MMFSSSLWRSTVALVFVAFYCSFQSTFLVDAFAPGLTYATRSVVGHGKISHDCSPPMQTCFQSTTPRQTSTKFLLHATNNDEGIPSSPLDRPVLSAIDTLSLLVFAGVGKASHSTVDGSLDLVAVLVTAFPFLVSWFLVAPLLGSYRPEATKDISSAAIQTTKAWALAVPLGCILRGVIKGYVPPVPFVVVTLIATLVILCAGRVGYTFLSELYVEMF